jgi:chemotaxis protein CheC
MTLEPYQLDILTEIVNIGVGRAASMLNQMLGSHVDLAVPVVRVVARRRMRAALEEAFGGPIRLSAVQLSFAGDLRGLALMVFPPESANRLVEAVTGEEPESGDLDALRVATLCEVGNIVINGVVGSLANVLGRTFTYSLPVFAEDLERTDVGPRDAVMLLARTLFTVEHHSVRGEFGLLFDAASFDGLASAVDAVGA